MWGEILIYGTLIGLSVNEYKKSQRSAQHHKNEEAKVLAGIHASIEGVEKSLVDLQKTIATMDARIHKLENTVYGAVTTNECYEKEVEIEPTNDE